MNVLNSTDVAARYTVALHKAGYEHVVAAVKDTFGSVGQFHFSIESLRRR
jgi:hypothetical protein